MHHIGFIGVCIKVFYSSIIAAPVAVRVLQDARRGFVKAGVPLFLLSSAATFSSTAGVSARPSAHAAVSVASCAYLRTQPCMMIGDDW